MRELSVSALYHSYSLCSDPVRQAILYYCYKYDFLIPSEHLKMLALTPSFVSLQFFKQKSLTKKQTAKHTLYD